MCEDIARQFVTYGHRKDVMATCAEIDEVTAEDLQALVDDFMSHPPSIGLVGHDLKTCPAYEDIAKFTSAYVLESRRIRGARKEGTSAADGGSVASG